MNSKDKLIEALVGLINAVAGLVNTATFLSIGTMALVMILAKEGLLGADKVFELALMVFANYFSAKAYSKAYEETLAKMQKTSVVTEAEEFDPYPTGATK